MNDFASNEITPDESHEKSEASPLENALHIIRIEFTKMSPDEEKLMKACKVVVDSHFSDRFLEYMEVYEICLDIHEAKTDTVVNRCSFQVYSAIRTGVKQNLVDLYRVACALLDLRRYPVPKKIDA